MIFGTPWLPVWISPDSLDQTSGSEFCGTMQRIRQTKPAGLKSAVASPPKVASRSLGTK